jgi:hypothetical protein
LDGKWKVIPRAHNHIVPFATSQIVPSPITDLSCVPLHQPSQGQGPNPVPSQITRAPKSPQQVSTPQKGISTTLEKAGRGGLKPKKNIEIRSSFHEDDEDLLEQEEAAAQAEAKGKNPNSHWRNDFFHRSSFSGGAERGLVERGGERGVLTRLDSETSCQSPESLSILNSYEPSHEEDEQEGSQLSGSVPAHSNRAIPIMMRSFYNGSIEPPEVYVPTLADFVEVCHPLSLLKSPFLNSLPSLSFSRKILLR